MAREFAKTFYKSKLWQDTREQILKRDRYRCQAAGCYNPAEEVHHIKWLTAENIGDSNITVNPSNLISLCRDCHISIHKNARIIALKKSVRNNLKKKNKILPDVEFDDNGYPVPIISPRGRG